ncbi:uncharacterized protein MONOS_15902 [Monocercomonoides exilis]|uniref:uncharacterized protein n=1 Tax=Monocercomonoides exilis TaxID=2049356 RepID=UPI0035599278|nr:hypothetical protein MONOS_15902 [Monocercomonoides exilis]|eukprot:MONOS_15902.1-p1 / transcript=MONOS_15902.1 / gene=MONOS_15902 / organism=Monocercomonoides_exilis_PA203 / gene_product=unspecified product / transcript_product=unspecified product / location=Mono_scaffold01398:525-2561(-) / protein_length=679 / sequence_SO=supercontig / SO=protein_coding / is_pseudo=false
MASFLSFPDVPSNSAQVEKIVTSALRGKNFIVNSFDQSQIKASNSSFPFQIIKAKDCNEHPSKQGYLFFDNMLEHFQCSSQNGNASQTFFSTSQLLDVRRPLPEIPSQSLRSEQCFGHNSIYLSLLSFYQQLHHSIIAESSALPAFSNSAEISGTQTPSYSENYLQMSFPKATQKTPFWHSSSFTSFFPCDPSSIYSDSLKSMKKSEEGNELEEELSEADAFILKDTSSLSSVSIDDQLMSNLGKRRILHLKLNRRLLEEEVDANEGVDKKWKTADLATRIHCEKSDGGSNIDEDQEYDEEEKERLMKEKARRREKAKRKQRKRKETAERENTICESQAKEKDEADGSKTHIRVDWESAGCGIRSQGSSPPASGALPHFRCFSGSRRSPGSSLCAPLHNKLPLSCNFSALPSSSDSIMPTSVLEAAAADGLAHVHGKRCLIEKDEKTKREIPKRGTRQERMQRKRLARAALAEQAHNAELLQEMQESEVLVLPFLAHGRWRSRLTQLPSLLDCHKTQLPSNTSNASNTSNTNNPSRHMQLALFDAFSYFPAPLQRLMPHSSSTLSPCLCESGQDLCDCRGWMQSGSRQLHSQHADSLFASQGARSRRIKDFRRSTAASLDLLLESACGEKANSLAFFPLLGSRERKAQRTRRSGRASMPSSSDCQPSACFEQSLHDAL